jgi:hypothetical protein
LQRQGARPECKKRANDQNQTNPDFKESGLHKDGAGDVYSVW